MSPDTTSPLTAYKCNACVGGHTVVLKDTHRHFKSEQAGAVIEKEIKELLYCVVCGEISALVDTGEIVHIPACPSCGEVSGLIEGEADVQSENNDDGVEQVYETYTCSSCGHSFS